jgi:hypothetical protein
MRRGRHKRLKSQRPHANLPVFSRISRHFPDGRGPSPSLSLDTAFAPRKARVFGVVTPATGVRDVSERRLA